MTTRANGTAINEALEATAAEPVTPVMLPPTPEQRQQAFIAGIEALQKQHGYTIVPQMKPAIHGDIVQVEAALVVVPISDWKDA